MESTPATLLERLRRPGDEEAWTRFVNLYTPLLYFWACRTGLRGQDAADLVQDVFATLVTRLPEFRYDATKNFRSWVRTLVLNRWRDLRRRQAAAPVQIGGSVPDDIPAPEAANALWEAEYHQHLVGRALDIMQADFQPATWKACWSLIVEGKSGEEVAREQGLSLAAVYAARSRVLRRLREELKGLLN